MDGSTQCGCSNATTLWHVDAAEWARSTASKASYVGPGDLCGENGLAALAKAALHSSAKIRGNVEVVVPVAFGRSIADERP
jgi:hypothetical protein